MRAPRIVLEVGCNHRGEIETALKMVRVALTFCPINFHGPDFPKPVIKFQKRTPRELLTEEQYNAPHPNPGNAYGPSYGAHREALELPIEDHELLKQYIESLGGEYQCSVWDLTSAQEIMGLYPRSIKIPSAANLNFELLGKLAGAYEGDLHVSLGMTTMPEMERIVSFLERLGRSKDTVLYACTSGYPVPAEQVCLLDLRRLRRVYGHRVKGIGFSGHHNGVALDVAATALGAAWIERHFTLNRAWKGTDHAASLEPEGARKLIRDTYLTAQALKPRPAELLPIEHAQRAKLKQRATDRVVPSTIKEQERKAA